MLDRARQVAREAHATQLDKLGRDYVDAHLRPIAEGCAVFGDDAEAAGWLHDIIEDQGFTAQRLREQGTPEHVIDAVESVTKGPREEPYDELITRACSDPLGRLVKLVDNAWNITCNPALAERDPDKARELMDKYLPARERLLAAAELTVDSPELAQVQEILDRHLTRLTAGS